MHSQDQMGSPVERFTVELISVGIYVRKMSLHLKHIYCDIIVSAQVLVTKITRKFKIIGSKRFIYLVYGPF